MASLGPLIATKHSMPPIIRGMLTASSSRDTEFRELLLARPGVNHSLAEFRQACAVTAGTRAAARVCSLTQ